MAERFSEIGGPAFLADVKGDLAGISRSGGGNPRVDARLAELGLTEGHEPATYPVVFRDVYGEQGHPVRATVTEMGSVLLPGLLGLNETQAGVLQIAFSYADDRGLLLLDLKDLCQVLQEVAANAKALTTQYGNVSAASVGDRSKIVNRSPVGNRYDALVDRESAFELLRAKAQRAAEADAAVSVAKAAEKAATADAKEGAAEEKCC